MLEKLDNEIELIQRHMGVLQAVVKNGPIGIMKLTDVLHDSQHHVRYSLRVLEQMGYIQATTSGAIATEKAFIMLKGFDNDLDALILKLRQLHTEE
ncbi:MAG TPA: hypothetical protein O0X27_06820 [Methanocorpusculum sp.]|nr:hypothetical protein [Methanocorpusculum sp.]